MKYLIAIVFLVWAESGFSQITVKKPAGLDGHLYSRTAKRKNPDTKIDGYHILIYNGDNRAKAEAIRLQFMAEFPDFAEVVWDEPNFKVYVGLFKTRFECMFLFNQIKNKFPTAIVVKDKIIYPPIK